MFFGEGVPSEACPTIFFSRYRKEKACPSFFCK